MSNQAAEPIQGADPRQPFLTAQDLQPNQGGQTQQPQVVINNGQATGPQGQRMFTEEEVGAIRTEEKTKLYDRMNGMEQELAALRQDREQREATLAQQQEAAEAATRAAEEEKMDVRQLLEKRDSEWQQRWTELEQARERDHAIFEQERRWNQLQEYKRNRVEQEEEWLIPELRDLIDGSTEAEIDHAIEVMKQRSASISQNYQAALAQQRGPIRGVAPTGAPPIGPMEQQTATQTLSVDDIRKMDPKTFAQYRDQLLGIASRAGVQGLRRDQAQQ